MVNGLTLVLPLPTPLGGSAGPLSAWRFASTRMGGMSCRRGFDGGRVGSFRVARWWGDPSGRRFVCRVAGVQCLPREGRISVIL